ncbi:MAG TPA: adenylate/guanylate cyclase domain-containing protein [Denitromonas sp.]|uniref:adenylate/guanylate cyclase domain-containing protein n=1 Tax=Denitromonas sp. TaxID=2734609 RepID=UPI001DB3E818|nr:adenylate/guanylate cyclase domain-containing protein [Rhodocyclaceae bacterium]MCP5222374.1 adenylate/guanylate cyclase domain-containing protein [Zoogloeaceae bacterium]HPR07292.1 adenylate/guanylate cyclase domain-containing protein [Denitromonas sp.]HQV14336.1 adenylate/guanylate cyclase domain-containing protein [Denitromonas sp.]
MAQQRNACMMYAELVGGERLAALLSETEAGHAIERSMNRIERVVEGQGGEILRRATDEICAAFERCDGAVLAASEMIDRVASLPPVRGVRLGIRIGLHHGPIDMEGPPSGEALSVAMRLAGMAHAGQALVSGATVLLLSPASRQVIRERDEAGLKVEGFEWPVFALSGRAGMATSVPPATRVSQRLRLRHQQDVHLIEELRPILLLGREMGNDVVVIDPRTSRQHARVERRREGFFLVDQSTNGTFVANESGSEQCIRGGEALLAGQGRIGCGFSALEVERDLVFFEIV